MANYLLPKFHFMVEWGGNKMAIESIEIAHEGLSIVR